MTPREVPPKRAEDRELAFLRQARMNPGWLLAAIDVVNDRAAFARLDEHGYRQANFLDQRAFGSNYRPVITRLSSLLEAAADAPEATPVHFIFHPGHVGSTLISRLLGELDRVLSLREPVPLLDLAGLWREQGTPLAALSPADYRRLEDTVIRLLGRRFSPGQPVIVKATSECCNLARRLLSHDSRNSAVWWYVDLETFLAGMLRNDLRRQETIGFARGRLADLHRRTGTGTPALHELDAATKAAANWLSVMANRLDVPEEGSHRVLDIHFHDFLAEPAGVLARVAGHLGLEADEDAVRRVVESDWMFRYAKSPQEPFDAHNRYRQLAESHQRNREAIERALAFADRLCGEHEALAPLARRLRPGAAPAELSSPARNP